MSEETVVTTEVTQAPVTPAAPAENTNAPAEEVKAPEAEQKDTEEQHRSRAWRRLDRWRQRAIEAETRLKLSQETKPVEKQRESDEPVRDQFGTYEEFIEARAEWKATKAADKTLREAIKRDEQESIRAEQEKTNQQWSKRIDSARDEIDDFDEICSESEATVTPHMSSAIMESDRGPHIAYYLAKNPEEAERIAKLSPSKQMAAIVNLEEKVAKPVKTPSKAPEPIKPVGKSASSDNDLPSEKDDTATWIRKEKARMEKMGIR